MIRLIICFVSQCFITVVCAQDIDLNEIRRDFNKGVKDEDLCEKYYSDLKQNAKTETEKGYEAAFQMFMAKHTGNPIRKMKYFNGGKGLLEKQIHANSNNIELRFIRLCIQYHLPNYLGYRDNIKEDKDFMMNNLYRLQDEKARIILYDHLKGANMYTEKELVLLGR